MTFEEWWDDCMKYTEYEPDNWHKGICRAAWEEAYKAGMDSLTKAHQIRPRGKSIITLHELHHRMQSDDL